MILHYGRALFEHKQTEFPKMTYEELRGNPSQYLTPEDIRSVDRVVADRVAEARDRSNVLIELHPVTLESFGWRATPYDRAVLDRILPDAVIHLAASPLEAQRRLALRPGSHTPRLEEIERLSGLLETASLVYSCRVGCPLFVVDATSELAVVAEKVALCLRSIGMGVLNDAPVATKES
jgi:adenylate kinase